MCLTFQKQHYYFIQLPSLALLSPHFHLRCVFLGDFTQLRVSSNLSCPSKRSQDEMAGALGL